MQRDRWKRGVAVIESVLGEAIGEQYVERHFPAEAKQQMDELVANLVEAYRRNIDALDWMGPETRRKALDKLAVFRPKIGYPPRWRDYSSVVIDRADLLGGVRRGNAFETDRQLGKLGGPVDPDEWLMYPQTVNAYYNPGTNEICFPAAILQPPFFDPDADAALNYGGIGAVIGHEIGHGFDDQGVAVRRRRQPARLVDRRGQGRLPRTRRQADRPVRRPRAAGAARAEGQRWTHCRREHRRPGRADDRAQGVPDQPGG